MKRRGWLVAAWLLGAASTASAEVPVQKTVHWLPSSNGHGALLVDLSTAKLHHFREHLFATEEPLLDAGGAEVWAGNQPQAVKSRDLLYDAYFGVRHDGQQGWLPSWTVDLDQSGYAPWKPGTRGGTGVTALVQRSGDLEATSFFFMPRSMPHSGFVMALRLRNLGTKAASGVQAFSLHNFHLGFGRPGVMEDIGDQGETIGHDAATGDLLERAFAGVVAARALGAVSHRAAWSSGAPDDKNVYNLVNQGGTSDAPDLVGEAPVGDGSVSAFQLALPDLAPGSEAWTGVAFAHHGDPFAAATTQQWLDEYVKKKGAQALVEAELAGWASFQQKLVVPAGLSADEEALFRQSAVMLAMGQNHEGESYLREWLTKDGEPRFTRFPADGGAPAKLPAVVKHKGKGAVLASLPPGEWTVSWARDSAYAIVALASAGLKAEAAEALGYYLSAEGGRFQDWNELKPYNMPPYQISLVRYHGFGVEETDFNDYGPNLEFDGFGLMLWALARYETLTGDTSVTDAYWPVVSTRVADALVGLIDPDTGLIRRDSSIWETHWNGRERYWTYTSLTAARGLCDAAALAQRVGDATLAATYRTTALALREAIARKLTDKTRALASNLEELQSGEGYHDAAVVDAIAMGLFDPKGTLAKATLAGLDAHLAVPAGAGWSRNDDRFDHANAKDLSDWGSSYDSAEWVITNLRGSVAARLGGDVARADQLVAWTTQQSTANLLEVAETYDENTGAYKFNSPMLGFGAGAYVLALAARSAPADPACGAYFDESVLPPAEQPGQGGAGGTSAGGAAGTSAGGAAGMTPGGSAGAGGASGGMSGSSGQPAGGASGAGAGGVSGGSGQAGGGAAAGGAAAGGAGGQAGATGGVSGAGSTAAPAVSEDDGCGCRAAGAGGAAPGWGSLGALLALAGLGRRRASRRRA